MGIEAVLERDAQKDLLRFLTCGSVDDGKSTLIGRLLHDSKQVYEDHLQTLAKDSKKVGSAGGAIDFSLLLDGLKAEREQGITIDVAYRYFSTPQRKFIIADCPGHVQYTRNMITGGSTCNLAVVLVDARHGILEQTRRHSFLVSLLDIGQVVVAVNKMDLVEFKQSVFDDIRRAYTEFAARLAVRNIMFIPLSALNGDNVVESSSTMPWYKGAPLLDHLENVHVASERNMIDLRLPVQYVLRQTSDFRGYSGSIASGILRPGSEVEILPSKRRTTVKEIVGYDGSLKEAFPPMSVTVTLADEVDVGRGDMIVSPQNVPRIDNSFEATLVWMDDSKELSKNRPYIMKLHTSETRAQVAALRYRFDVNTLGRLEAPTLALNEIGRVRMELAASVAFDPYKRNHQTGSFILIDPVTHQTVAAGMILDRLVTGEDKASRDGSTLHPKESQVTGVERADRLKQNPHTVWLTGLPKAGKTTLAYALERRLHDQGHSVFVLDGTNLRLGLSDDLGFQALERGEAVRRAAHVAKLMNDAGLITVVALVSPFAADRDAARRIIGDDRFVEVYLNAPADACEARDNENLYARARAGKIRGFTGVEGPYDPPPSAELVLPSHEIDVDESVERLLTLLNPKLAV